MPAKKAAKKAPESDPAKLDDSQKGKKAPKLTPVGKMAVDFWATSMHKAKIGVMQSTRYSAATKAFTKDFEINGAIKRDGKDIGFCGYRTGAWDDAQPPKRRLVLKFFNQDPDNENKIDHVGSIESMVMASTRAMLSSNTSLLEFRAMVKGTRYLAVIKREFTKMTKWGESFAMEFPFSDDEFRIIEFDEDRFTIGSDWEVKDQTGRVLAYIDEKTMNIGGKFDITFYDQQWYKNDDFVTLVILFTMTLKYHKELKEDVVKVLEGIRSGKMKLTPDSDEKALLLNPRGFGKRT